MSDKNVFATVDYQGRFPDLVGYGATLEFPYPFTLDSYRKWFRALNIGGKAEKGSPLNDIVFLRQYKAAMEVGTVTAVMPQVADAEKTADEQQETERDEFDIDVDTFTLSPAPLDTNLLEWDNANLPLPFASFVVEAAEQYIGGQLIVEGDQARLQRRLEETYDKPVFRYDHCLHLLPGMTAWRGYVVYQSPVSSTLYREWSKICDRIKGDPRDINNHRFMRAIRAAGYLVKEFKFEGLDWQTVKANDYANLPLIVASFLVETADIYLSRRVTLKKMPKP